MLSAFEREGVCVLLVGRDSPSTHEENRFACVERYKGALYNMI